MAARHDLAGDARRRSPGSLGRQVEDLPRPPPDRAGSLERLGAVELDDVRVERRDDRGQLPPARRRR